MNIAVITGASSGLGWEYAKAIYETRADLDGIWVIARREERLRELQAELGKKIIPVAFDITDPQSVEDYHNGKEKAIGFLVGQAMKATKGKANPGIINKILKELL